MVELHSATFTVAEVTYPVVQDAFERLWIVKHIDPSHLLLSQEDYDALEEEVLTTTCTAITSDGSFIPIKHRFPGKLAWLVNLATGNAMKCGVSPKIVKGSFAVLYQLPESWKEEVKDGRGSNNPNTTKSPDRAQ